MKVVSLIPARGGSKRIPRKNIIKVCSVPLIDYIIKSSLNSNVDETWVSTEDREIKDISIKCGAKVIDRPKELATDTSSTEAVVEHFLNNVNCDVLVLLEATNPLLSFLDINNTLETFQISDCDSLVGLENQKLFTWIVNNNLASPVNFDYKNRPRTQDFKGCYTETPGIWIMTKHGFLIHKCRLFGNIGYYIIQNRSIDIDEPIDIKIAEAIINARN